MPKRLSEDYAEQLKVAVSREIRKTFDAVAKLALQGSSEADDPSLNVLEKMRKAHTRVTLIIDDAMRGLAQLNEEMIRGGLLTGAASAAEEDDEEPRSPGSG